MRNSAIAPECSVCQCCSLRKCLIVFTHIWLSFFHYHYRLNNGINRISIRNRICLNFKMHSLRTDVACIFRFIRRIRHKLKNIRIDAYAGRSNEEWIAHFFACSRNRRQPFPIGTSRQCMNHNFLGQGKRFRYAYYARLHRSGIANEPHSRIFIHVKCFNIGNGRRFMRFDYRAALDFNRCRNRTANSQSVTKYSPRIYILGRYHYFSVICRRICDGHKYICLTMGRRTNKQRSILVAFKFAAPSHPKIVVIGIKSYRIFFCTLYGSRAKKIVVIVYNFLIASVYRMDNITSVEYKIFVGLLFTPKIQLATATVITHRKRSSGKRVTSPRCGEAPSANYIIVFICKKPCTRLTFSSACTPLRPIYHIG